MRHRIEPKEHKTKLVPVEKQEHVCAKKGCEFEGKRPQQGICFNPFSRIDKTYHEIVHKRAKDMVREATHGCKTAAEKIRQLEGYLLCAEMNYDFTIKELIYLRAKVGRLERGSGKPDGGTR